MVIMKKKSRMRFFMLLIVALAIVVACEDDNEKKWSTTSDPSLVLTTNEIHSGVDRTFTIKGTIADEVGIEKINLRIDEWYLDRDIQILKEDNLVKEYSLEYNFKIPKDATDKKFVITVTVTNVGKQTTSKQLSVFLDGDFDAPTLTVVSPASGLTVTPDTEIPIDLNCQLTDARQLGYFVVRESNLNFYDSISFAGTGAKNFDYAKTVVLPAKVSDYTFNFTVADSAGLVVSTDRTVRASFVYNKMYLADVATDMDLVSDLFGVPMLIKTTGENKFLAQYYAEKPNSEIRFIPQTTSFAPHCFGIDPNNSAKLIDSPTALPIVLPSVGYYKIAIDVDALTYQVEAYVPTDGYYVTNISDDDNTYIGKLSLVGHGFAEYSTNWDTKTGVPFDHEENTYRFTKELDLEGDVEFIFSPQHKSGSWPKPFWRFDRKEDPETAVRNGGDNVDMTVPIRTRYKVVFDSHLNRAKVIKVN